jgi:hypothetical protein
MPDFFRVRLGVVARSAGHSAAKRSAYQACALAIDHLGRRFDFSRKAAERAMPTVMLAPDGAPRWCLDPASLWNRAATAEKRIDAQEARIMDFSMPRAVPSGLWADAVRHVYEPFRALGMALQIDVHDTPASDGDRNVNVHGLLSLRRIEGDRFSRIKERAWNDLFREREGRTIRDLVADRLTTFCRQHGIAYQGDARPNVVRGLPAPEPELPAWNVQAMKRTGALTPAVADLHQHRGRRRAWQAAVDELAAANVRCIGLERASSSIIVPRTDPVDRAERSSPRLLPNHLSTSDTSTAQVRSGSLSVYLKILESHARKQDLHLTADPKRDPSSVGPAYKLVPKFGNVDER